MTDVFISYSRKDTIFTRRLFDRLTASERTTWADWEGIPYSVDFWQEICQGIDAAEAFVFIISPDSLASMVCNQELTYARNNNKRILPVLHREVDDRAMAGEWFGKEWEKEARDNWNEVKKLQWLLFREQDDFEKGFTGLIETIDNDPEMVRFHTRILVKAREWEAVRDRDLGQLLRGEELRDAEAWLKFNVDTPPQPTELHIQYIQASVEQREHEHTQELKRQARLRSLTMILSVLLLFALIATGIAINRSQAANESANTAEYRSTLVAQQAETSDNNANLAATNAGIADQNAGTAIANADLAATSQAIAERRAEEQQSLAMAMNARELLDDGNTDLALALAFQAAQIPNPPVQAERILGNIAFNPGTRWIFHLPSFADGMSEAAGFEISNYAQATMQGGLRGNVPPGAATSQAQFATSIANISQLQSELEAGTVGRVGARDLEYSPDGTSIGAVNGFGVSRLTILDAARGIERWTILSEREDFWENLAYSPDGRTILVAGTDGLTLVNSTTGVPIALPGNLGRINERVRDALFLPDGDSVLLALDTELQLMNLQTGERERTMQGGNRALIGITLSPDGKTAISVDQGNTFIVWDVETGAERQRIEAADLRTVEAIAYNPQESLIATVHGSEIYLWDISTGERVRRLTGHTSTVNTIDFSPDGETIASGSSDGTILLWQLDTGAIISQRRDHTSEVTKVIYSLDGSTFVSSSNDASIRLAEAQTNPSLYRIFGNDEQPDNNQTTEHAHDGTVVAIAFSPDGKTAATAGRDQTIRVWEVDTGITRHIFHTFALNSNSRLIFSPDGSKIVKSSAGEWVIWDVETGERIAGSGDTLGTVWGIALSPDGTQLAIAESNPPDSTAEAMTPGANRVTLRDLYTGEILRSYVIDEFLSNDVMTALTFSLDGGTIYAGSIGGRVYALNIETGEADVYQDTHDDWINQIVLSSDGSRLLTASDDNTAILWDTATKTSLLHLSEGSASVHSVSFSPDGLVGLVGSADSSLILYDLTTGEVIRRLSEGTDNLSSAAYSPDGHYILAGDIAGNVVRWSMQTPDELQTWIMENRYLRDFTCQERLQYNLLPYCDLSTPTPTLTPTAYTVLGSPLVIVYGARWNADASEILSSNADGTVRVWDTATGQQKLLLPGHTDDILWSFWSPDETRILTGNSNNTARVWDAHTGALLYTLANHQIVVNDGSWSPDGSRIVTADSSGILNIWDSANGTLIQTIDAHRGDISLYYSPDGTRLATVSEDQTAKIWDTETWGLLFTLTGHEGGLLRGDWSPDGTRFVTTSEDHTAIIWDTTTGEAIQSLRGHTEWVLNPIWSPDGRRLTTGSYDQTGRVWDAENGSTQFIFGRFDGAVPGARWSADGSQIMTFSLDGNVRLYDSESGTQIRAFTHPYSVYSARWSPDETKILTGSTDGLLRIWDANTGDLLLTFPTPGSIPTPPPTSTVNPAYTRTPMPTATPTRAFAQAIRGENNGELGAGEPQVWVYTPTENEYVSVRVTADFDTTLLVRDPYGTILAQNDDLSHVDLNSLILSIELAQDIPYQIEVGSYQNRSRGAYVLTIDEPQITNSAADILAEAFGLDLSEASAAAFVERGAAVVGRNAGELIPGGRETWTYEGRDGEVVSLRMLATWDTFLRVYAPDGTILAENDDSPLLLTSLIESLVLPATGRYQIEITSFDNASGGAYTLRIETEARETPSPPPPEATAESTQKS